MTSIDAGWFTKIKQYNKSNYPEDQYEDKYDNEGENEKNVAVTTTVVTPLGKVDKDNNHVFNPSEEYWKKIRSNRKLSMKQLIKINPSKVRISLMSLFKCEN